MNTQKNIERIDRGDIYYISKDPYRNAVGSEIYADRPAVILSTARQIAETERAVVVFLTTSPKCDSVSHVKINVNGKKSIALCEQINTVSVNRIVNLMGVCSEEEMESINRGLLRALNIKEECEEVQQSQEAVAGVIDLMQKDIDFYKNMCRELTARFIK